MIIIASTTKSLFSLRYYHFYYYFFTFPTTLASTIATYIIAVTSQIIAVTSSLSSYWIASLSLDILIILIIVR